MADVGRYVTDTNIWVDFYKGNILPAVFQFPAHFVIPDLVIGELLAPDKQTLLTRGLEAVTLSSEQVTLALSLRERIPPNKVSTNDLFVFVLAKTWNAVLLTGDQRLRQIAIQHNVRVYGTLWLMDKLVELQILSPAQAVEGLVKMRNNGRRLPPDECEKRLKKWRMGK